MTTPKVGRTKAQIKLVFEPENADEFGLRQLIEELGLELQSFATSAGVLLMKAIMKMEEDFLAGARRTRSTEINRWCKEKGSLVVGGQRVPITRQRLRTRDGEEVPLTSYQLFHQESVSVIVLAVRRSTFFSVAS